MADQHRRALLESKSRRDVARGLGSAKAQHLDRGLSPLALDFDEERGLADVSVLPGEAVRGEPLHGRQGANEAPPAVLDLNQSLDLQEVDRLPDRAASGAIRVHKDPFARQARARREFAAYDAVAQVVGDLLVSGSVARGVYAVLQSHNCSSQVYQLPNSSTPMHSVSVAAAIVNRDGRVLAIRRRDNSHWEPPGGVLDRDESIPEGLIREVREETGLTVEPEALTGVYKNMVRGIVALVFRCRTADEPLTSTAEAQEIRWLSAEELPTHMDEAYAVRMLDALTPGPPEIRAHDGTTLLAGR